jgi:S1-C subfamily serine protease
MSRWPVLISLLTCLTINLYAETGLAQDPLIPDSILQIGAAQSLNRVDDTLDPLKIAFPPQLIASTLAQLRPEPAFSARGPLEIQIFAKTSPAVVFVFTKDGSGSGSLIDPNGLILTNEHVVENASEVGVLFKSEITDVAAGKKSAHVASVVATDHKRDLALIKVDRIPPEAHPIVVGDSTRLQVGSDVHAIGHPEGQFWTYTRGFVSQIRPNFEWLGHKADVIQTQTPIAPGSSGGPLLDNDGKLSIPPKRGRIPQLCCSLGRGQRIHG